MKELKVIQTSLVAPKNLYNKFGNYSYRSAESILEALKPLLLEQDCFLTISDSIELIGDRFYIKAMATITNSENQSVSVSAFAREEETKKGMDGAQVTGSASSYARKYALNGLFCIDDTKDPDSTNDHGKGEKTAPEQPKIEQKNLSLVDAKLILRDAMNIGAIMQVWNENEHLHTNKYFTDYCTQRRKELETKK